MADEKPDAPEEKKASKLAFLENKTVLLGVIVVVQALLAVGLTQFVILPRMGVQSAALVEEPVAEEEELSPEAGTIVDLEEIIVTLDSDPRKPRHLLIKVALEIRDPAVAERTLGRIPQMRDVVIMALADKTVEDMSSHDGKRTLRDEIGRDIGALLPEGSLMNVYFSDLVVQ
ncbi:MAG: flagellar basal body-associated FliL family protein [bacterium]|nr:flagellar basal body-associated FliL family protein [bacterium]